MFDVHSAVVCVLWYWLEGRGGAVLLKALELKAASAFHTSRAAVALLQ